MLFLSLWALDAAGWIRNPYVGLLAFIAIPACFAVGLLLIPLGNHLAGEATRTAGLAALSPWPAIDLNEPRARRFALLIVLATVVNIVLIAAAGHGAVDMDSPAFCGGICHTPMQPQYVQWQTGAARADRVC